MGCCENGIKTTNETPGIEQTTQKNNLDEGNINFKEIKNNNSNKNEDFIKINSCDASNDRKSSSSKKEIVSESNNFIDNKSSDSGEVGGELKYIIKKNRNSFVYVFGTNFLNRYRKFFEILTYLNQLAFELKTSLYTLSYEEVKEIIDGINEPQISENGLISEQFYNLVLEFGRKLKQIGYVDVYELLSGIEGIHVEIISVFITHLVLTKKINKNNLTFFFIRYLQDIGFCIRFFNNILSAILLQDEFLGYDYHFDIRILYFLEMSNSFFSKVDFPQDLLKYATESARIKDTIIIGTNNFKNHIRGLNLTCERIHELDENKFDSFFKNPYKVDNKYKITKYFVICEKELENKYFDLFKCLSSKYGFGYLFLIYEKNKDLKDVKYDLKTINPIIYFYEDLELLEIYKDNNIRLKASLDKFLPKNLSITLLEINKLLKFVYNDIKDFKSNCEDGWDIFEKNIFNKNKMMSINLLSFHDFIDQVLRNIIKSYKENNSLEIFFKYYSNYFCLTLQPQLIMSATAYAKMFLYAYTLEEGDPHKNLYCIINNDLRSSIPENINRHFDLIKLIGGLIKNKSLKSFNDTVYRATFLKNELIQKIKIGQTMINSAFWSSTKKESVAKRFLNLNHKNCLIITKGEANNNVDIHLEEISKYPDEEEVLFLPFCTFKVKNFDEVNEGNLCYYKLVLEKDSATPFIKPFEEREIESFNFNKKKYY